jgi:hypothetical protein
MYVFAFQTEQCYLYFVFILYYVPSCDMSWTWSGILHSNSWRFNTESPALYHRRRLAQPITAHPKRIRMSPHPYYGFRSRNSAPRKQVAMTLRRPIRWRTKGSIFSPWSLIGQFNHYGFRSRSRDFRYYIYVSSDLIGSLYDIVIFAVICYRCAINRAL